MTTLLVFFGGFYFGLFIMALFSINKDMEEDEEND